MPVDYAKKTRIRAGHRGATTRMLKEVDTAIGTPSVDCDRLSQLKLSLDEKLQTLKSLDTEIVELVPEEELDKEIEQADGYKHSIFRALTQIEKALHIASTSRSMSSSTDMPKPIPVSASVHKVKLPKIVLPHFGGNLMKWPSFWDSYESAVHRNPDLSDVDKFNYLRSLLEHSAYEAIAGLTLSSANYKDAVEILKKRFGDTQLIISKHMEALLAVEMVESDKNLRGLRQLYDKVESHIRSLKALDVSSESYGTMLTSVLLKKLPPDVRLIIGRKVKGSEPKIGELLTMIEEELTARERTSSSETPHYRKLDKDKGKATATALLANATRSCCYCQQNHLSRDCTAVTSVTDRKQMLRSSGRCFNCLAKGHLGRNCRSAGRCYKCKGRHHTSVCGVQETPSLIQPTGTVTGSSSRLNPEATTFSSTPTTPTSNNFCASHSRSVLLQTARACIYNVSEPHHSLEVRLLLDGGSQRSYLSNRASRQLALNPKGEQQLSIATFGSNRERVQACSIVEVGMRMKNFPPLCLSLYVVPTICEPLVSQPIASCVSDSCHLASLDLADYSDGESSLEVDLLIGSDFYWDLVTGGVSRGTQGPVAIHTKLGWVLSGPTSSRELTRSSTNLVTTHVLRVDAQPSEQESLEKQLQSFWDLESLGIIGVEKTIYDEFLASVSFQNGRYEVSLPWKESHNPLPNNYQLSYKRLWGLLRRLKQSPSVLQQYNSIIEDQIKQGVVEPVSDLTTSNLCHYLPHHAVVRIDRSTTKLRIVYDASARSADGPSLNDCLNKGPTFNQFIFNILLRFRAYQIALTADLEKAFLQVSVFESDRDVLRFLWVDDVSKEHPELRVLRFTRVVFGVAASPFLLNATLKYHLEKYAATQPDTIRRLLDSTYVDDIVTGADTEDDAFELYSQSKSIFRDGAFNLRKFVTNSEQLQKRIYCAEHTSVPDVTSDDCLDETYVKATLGDFHELGVEEQKVLGVRWRPSDDCFVFDVSAVVEFASTLEPTKRHVISTVSKFFDPLGFLTPVTIRFKVFFQKLCERKVDWDVLLSDDLMLEWKKLLNDLRGRVPLSVSRRYFSGDDKNTSRYLCGFCDASSRAYAAVVYLVSTDDENTEISFVAAKTRVAPLKSQTIPRLELLSALLLSRLISTVAESLKSAISQLEMKCFTDSQVSLYWIQGVQREWKPFVRNRVVEIRQRVPPDRWSHCSGDTNPADLPSRGLSLLELSVNTLWRCGPEWLPTFLSRDSHMETETSTMPEECALEIRKTPPAYTMLAVEVGPHLEQFMECSRYGSLSRLLRVTAYVIRAVQLFKGKIPKRRALASIDLVEAETLWLISAQGALSQDKSFASWQREFTLFRDKQGLWRCGGRLTNADLPYDTMHPVLLPRKHYLTTLIVQDAHGKVGHDGVKETLTEVRRKFWIVKGRSLVKSLIHKCVLCRRFEGASFRAPQPPPLPTFRVKEEPPFSYTGVDFAGPLHVRSFGMTTSEKVWICLFTCLVTRAVHLDVVTDLSTETFIRCLKRFAARRGFPHKFLSDNGKTFKAAARFIKTVFKEDIVQNHLSSRGVDWVFNIEKAPWWGGAFERMVRSVKRCLRKMVSRSRLTLDELCTALVEVEAIINSRPLSYISSTDLEEPVTPSHLLVGRRLLSLPDHLGFTIDPEDTEFSVGSTSSQLNQRVKKLNGVLNYFWNRWRDEYLIELRETHRQAHRSRAQPSSVLVGDMVIVHDDSLPRGFWRVGKIEKTIPGRDGKVRGATVRLSSGTGVLRRPIQLLYPLEVHHDDSDNVENQDDDNMSTVSEATHSGSVVLDDTGGNQPRRRAAFQARDRMKALALCDSDTDTELS